MRYVGAAVACVGLLIQVAGAYAIQFAPPRSVVAEEEAGAAGKQPLGLTVGLAASSWDLPSTGSFLVTGDKLQFDSQVRPLLTADYQFSPKLSVGGWANAIAWDANLTLPSGTGFKLADVDGVLWELHGTYTLPTVAGIGLSAQAGYQRAGLDIKIPAAVMTAIAGTPTAAATATSIQDKVVLWGLGSYNLKGGEEQGPLTFLGGLGLQQNLRGAKFTEANLLLGGSYAVTPAISADASVWFNDFLRSENAIRFTAGVTGRF